MRWKFFFACLGLSVVALVASLVVGALLPHDANELSGDAQRADRPAWSRPAIVILLTTPLQAIGEEYAFRGYLMQAFGSFFDGVADALGLSRWTARIAAGSRC